MMMSRTDIEATILRTPGMLFQEQDDGRISNMYSITAVNKTRDEQQISVEVLSHDADVLIPSGELRLKPKSDVEAVFFVIMNDALNKQRNTPLKIAVFRDDEQLYEKEINFVSPIK